MAKPNVGIGRPTTEEYTRRHGEEVGGVFTLLADYSDTPGEVSEAIVVKGGAHLS